MDCGEGKKRFRAIENKRLHRFGGQAVIELWRTTTVGLDKDS